MNLEARLRKLGYPWAPSPLQHPIHPLLNAKRCGNQVFVSGQIPFDTNGQPIAGKVGSWTQVSPAKAADAAKDCAVRCLYAAGAVVSPEDIVGIVKVTVYVNVFDGFTSMSQVANGASELLIEVFGEQGKHARSAIGVSELPSGAAVEVDMIIEVRA
jgi:enamine deaminase RidA (YjgF/YER057c/UK114 family)